MTHLAKIPTFTIRQAVLADFDAMAPLWFQLDGYHQGKDPRRFPGTPQDAPRALSYIKELIHCADRALLVAQSCPGIEGGERTAYWSKPGVAENLPSRARPSSSSGV